MSKFAPTSKKLVEKIDELLDKGEKLFKEIVSYFGEPAVSSLDEFFGEIYRFGIVFEKTKGEIQRKRDLEIRQRQRQEQQEKQKQQQQTKLPMGRLEQAIADLTSGNAYATGKQYKGRQQPTTQRKDPIDSGTTNTALSARIPRTSQRPDTEDPRNPLSMPNTPRTPRSAQQVVVQKDQLAAALAFLKKYFFCILRANCH